jgi:hypothetical protein
VRVGTETESRMSQSAVRPRAALRRRRTVQVLGVLIALTGLAAVLAGPASAAEETARPAWSLKVLANPTVLPPETEAEREVGPMYHIVATNIGGAATEGVFTITDELPVGVEVAEIEMFGEKVEPMIQWARNEQRANCSVTGRVVTCEGGGPGTDDDGEPMSETPEAPGLTVDARIWVDVEAAAGSVLENKVSIEGGGAEPVSKAIRNEVSSTRPPFGFTPGTSGLFGTAVTSSGATDTQAGSHPESYEVESLNVNNYIQDSYESNIVEGGFRDVKVNLPQGMVVNPTAVPQCSESQLEASFEEVLNGLGCPAGSQVGFINISFTFSGSYQESGIPLFNMIPPAGAPAEFGFSFIEGLYNHIEGLVRTGGDYGLSAIATDIPAKLALDGIKVNLWGDPTSPLHDEVRDLCTNFTHNEAECPAEERLTKPFVSMPSSCGGPLTTSVGISSWDNSTTFVEKSFLSSDANDNPVGVDGCNRLQFNPTIESKATTNLTDSPTGLNFNLAVPQSENVESLSTANLKDAQITLPEGMVINPSAGGGLEGCTAAGIEIHGPNPATCPDASKIGTAEVITPLVDHPLPGAVYLAKPFENQFDSLLAVYIAVSDPRTGVVLKLPGEVRPDPTTGRLVATFPNNPELPFNELKVAFFNGARAPLTSPPTCGTNATSATLTPWSSPEGAAVVSSDSFTTAASPLGGACPTSTAQLPNQISFQAGTQAPKAGAYSPFLLKITRPDGSQRMTTIDTTLPAGLTGKLAGIPYCSEAQIAAAQARSHPNEGALERNSPSCPLASEVGTVTVAAGSGPNPVYVQGHAYLAGPYKGAPISLVVITPAIAGPFDLGNVVVRVALHVDPETTQIHAVSDPLPTILQGIPLDIRSVALTLGRPGFTLNPTSCDPESLAGTIGLASGAGSPVSSPFQVGECSALPFKPKVSLKFGASKRRSHPALTAVVTQPAGQANIATTSVKLPKTAFLDQSHIKTICTRVQFAEGNVPGEKCPAASIYGKAHATTPLLAEPISGPVYLRSSSHQLPDLVASLHGQVNIVLDGKIDSVKRALRTSFEAVPDAPVSKFVLEMDGGRKGLIINSTDLCKSNDHANVKMSGQNGKQLELSPTVQVSCGKAGGKTKQSGDKKKHGAKRRSS